MKRAYQDAAEKVGLSPAQIQAITWVHAVPPDATVGTFMEMGTWDLGRWYYSVPKHGATQAFRTPFRAFMALQTEGDIYTAEDNGPRAKLAHRSAKGVWT